MGTGHDSKEKYNGSKHILWNIKHRVADEREEKDKWEKRNVVG